MPESLKKNSDYNEITDKALFKRTTEELARHILGLQQANEEIHNARRAALNVMEDAILTKEALRESEERLRITMESALDYAIITMNTERTIQGWSKGAELIFGYTAEEVIAKPADIIFTDEDKAAGAPQQEMETARDKGRAEDERWHQRKDGTRFYMSGVMRPIYNPSLTGYVKVARDMTRQKLLEQQKDDFISIASHELKTPVTSIKAYTELLEEMHNESDYATSGDVVKKLGLQVDRFIDLIHLLLDTTKIATGQLILSPSTFDINTLIAEKVHELQHTTEKHNLKFTTRKEILVTADRQRIGEVLTNIIYNAIKYSPEGGDISINSIKTGNGVQVSVQDKGVGISDEVKSKIFERFYKVRNARIDTFPGLGLGLYIVSEIIKEHNGKIWVESKLNKGSIFYFLLPSNSTL